MKRKNQPKQAKYNVSRLVAKTKQDFLKNKINENKHNSRKLWNLMKCLSRDDDESRSGIEHGRWKQKNIGGGTLEIVLSSLLPHTPLFPSL